jgi:hypothetical protein
MLTLKLCSKLVALMVVPLKLTMPRLPIRFGELVPKLKGRILQEINQHKPQKLVKVLQELLQLQQMVCIGIDVFVVNGHIFFMTYSRKFVLPQSLT